MTVGAGSGHDVVVVGAGAAGLTAAESLRRDGFAGRITLVGDEHHAPYDRPPLSKQVLAGEWEAARAALRPDEHYRAQDIDLSLRTTARALDPATRRLTLATGEELGYRHLVIATGVTPRRLPFGHDLHGVHTLKTIDDAAAIAQGLASASRVLVVGAGFLGTEIAATARKLGREVVVVDVLDAPLVRGLGAWMGEVVRDVHAANGVEIRTGTGIVGLTSLDGRVTGADLSDGSHLAADLVVVAIGSQPTTGWLGRSGIGLDDGVLCDEFCFAAEDVVAVGDVARFRHLGYGRSLRLEHRMNATEQARAAVANLLAPPEGRVAFEPIPYFWTDQYAYKIQAYGLTPADAAVRVVRGDVAERRFVAAYEVDGRAVGFVGWNSPRDLRALLPELEHRRVDV
ncbi:NAD(P)/FAD-dependent oxidoreductase [Nocardioides humi]|uniref:FAD-dependent oxidoreductase n=1 Tax=Nocardioides humi TaxID=449461 RepID=A0ABN2BYF3_9ACTN|nr:FAD-dependent oxidoreductase [Nocardioides humi]